MDGTVVVLAVATKVLKDPLRDLCCHVAICSLGALRTNFLVVEQKNHVYLRMVAFFCFVL